jgi:solute carrier family 25 carnitine/acylcarnitine transporter 20/29
VQLAREGGIASLFRGIGITLIRDVPSFGAYFATYEVLKRSFLHGDKTSLSTWQTLFAGGVAGFGAWIPAYMQDVIKSKYQADASYTSWVKVAKDLYATNGFRAFWRGIGPTLLRAFPAVSFSPEMLT